MKKPYEAPELVIELFTGRDVIVCSWGEELPGDDDLDPIIIDPGKGGDSAP